MAHLHPTSVKRRGGPHPAMLAIVAAIVAGAGFVGFQFWKAGQEKAMAQAYAWTANGPPCPSLPHTALAAQPSPPSTNFNYYDVNFARVGGNVSCDEIKSDGGKGSDTVHVCKFNSPELLEIKTAKADLVFGPKLYQPVVVSIEHDQATCQLIPPERLKDMMASF